MFRSMNNFTKNSYVGKLSDLGDWIRGKPGYVFSVGKSEFNARS